MPPQKLSIPQTYTSIIAKGEQEGRKIGFPTANFLRLPSTNQLATGIYFGSAVLKVHSDTKSVSKPCLVYFGPRHIKGQLQNNFEVYIYDFSQDIYGQSLTVTLTHFLRPPLKTKDLDELIKMIENDKAQGQELIDSTPAAEENLLD